MTGENGEMNTGWVCPKCGRVYAPHVGACWCCIPSAAGLAGTSIYYGSTTLPSDCPHCWPCTRGVSAICLGCPYQPTRADITTGLVREQQAMEKKP